MVEVLKPTSSIYAFIEPFVFTKRKTLLIFFNVKLLVTTWYISAQTGQAEHDVTITTSEVNQTTEPQNLTLGIPGI